MRRVGLDACLFIAAFRTDHTYPPEVSSGVRQVLEAVEAGKLYPVVSAILVAELLDGSLQILDALLDGRKGEFVDADRPVMDLAREIRNKTARPSGRNTFAHLGLADTVHLATAVLYRCDAFVTIDGYTSDRLTPLNVADVMHKEYRLQVCPPWEVVEQPSLDFNSSRSDAP